MSSQPASAFASASDANPPFSLVSGLGMDEVQEDKETDFAEVEAFLEGLGLAARFARHFKEQGVVTMQLLLQLERSDMQQLNLGVGHIRTLQAAISTRKTEEQRVSHALRPHTLPPVKLTWKVVAAVVGSLAVAGRVGVSVWEVPPWEVPEAAADADVQRLLQHLQLDQIEVIENPSGSATPTFSLLDDLGGCRSGQATNNQPCRVKLTLTMDDFDELRAKWVHESNFKLDSAGQLEVWEPVDWDKVYHRACASGDIAMMKTCLEGEPARATSTAVQSVSNQTCLHLAAKNGHDEFLSLLIKAPGAAALLPEINSRDAEGYTPLHTAALHGHNNCIKPLLEAGADLVALDKRGRSILQLAAWNGHTHFVKVAMEAEPSLLQVRDKEERTALHLAAAAGHTNTTEFLLQVGLECDTPRRIGRAASLECDTPSGKNGCLSGNAGGTALLHAVNGGHAETVALLLKQASCNTGALDADGNNALHRAAELGHLGIVQALTATETIDLNARGFPSHTALHMAAEAGHLGIMKHLVDIGGIQLLKTTDILSTTALHTAAGLGHTEVVKYLLSQGLDPDSSERGFGRAPLLIAASRGHLEVAKLLIEAGCNKRSRAKHGDMAVDEARRNGHTAMVEYLKSQGCPSRSDDFNFRFSGECGTAGFRALATASDGHSPSETR